MSPPAGPVGGFPPAAPRRVAQHGQQEVGQVVPCRGEEEKLVELKRPLMEGTWKYDQRGSLPGGALTRASLQTRPRADSKKACIVAVRRRSTEKLHERPHTQMRDAECISPIIRVLTRMPSPSKSCTASVHTVLRPSRTTRKSLTSSGCTTPCAL